jgi:hypothetical protein
LFNEIETQHGHCKNIAYLFRKHKYYKSTDCPTFPICEAERKPADGFLTLLPAPARRALENKNISTEKQLSRFTEKEILSLHGVGPSTIPVLKKVLSDKGFAFKKSKVR